MYVQHNGVAIGAPFIPVMAYIFIAYLETTLMNELKSIGGCEWHRYVYDTFIVVDSNTKVDDILTILNNFHPSIKLTHGNKVKNSLTFLDSMLRRAFLIYSSCTSLTGKFDEVRRIGQANDYPLSFIDVHTGIEISSHLGKNDKKQVVLVCQKKQVYVEISCTEQPAFTLTKQISHLSRKLRPDLDVLFLNKPPASVQTFF
jgi:hypothetical protein